MRRIFSLPEESCVHMSQAVQHARVVRAGRFWALFFLTCWPLASPAAFDPTDVVQIQASATWIHDNNLFRLPDVSAPPPGSGIDPAKTADTTRILGAGLKLDKTVSRQRLIADLNLNQSAYEKNTNLDYVGGDGRLAWLWQVGSSWSGEAGYRRRRAATAFTDYHLNEQDLVDTEAITLAGGYELPTRWRIAAELAEEDSTHSVQQTLDVNSRWAGATLSYRTLVDDSIGVQARRTSRYYPNRVAVGVVTIDNAHTETRLNAVVSWRSSGKLKLDAQVGHVDVRFDTLSRRDFSGLTWRVAAIWEPGGKFRMSLAGLQDVQLFETDATSYVVVRSLGLSPIYEVTSKIAVQGDFKVEKREYRGDPGFVLTGVPAREDDIRLARVSVRYLPGRNVELSVSYEAGDRRSNEPLNDFEYRSWLGAVKASF